MKYTNCKVPSSSVRTFLVMACLSMLAGIVVPLRAFAESPLPTWQDPTQAGNSLSTPVLSPPDIKNQSLRQQGATAGVQAATLSQSLPGYIVRPSISTAQYTSAGACLFADSQPHVFFNTPLILPQGSEISRFRMYYFDSSVENSDAWLIITDHFGATEGAWQVISTGSSGFGFQDSEIIGHVVDHNQFTYSLIWRPVIVGGAMQLCSFQVFYSLPNPLIFQDRFQGQ